MDLAASFVLGVAVDICTRSFLVLSDREEGYVLECDYLEQFLTSLALVRLELEPAQIGFQILPLLSNHKITEQQVDPKKNLRLLAHLRREYVRQGAVFTSVRLDEYAQLLDERRKRVTTFGNY